MVVIKYKKTGLGAFIGDEEMQDCWSRVVSRAGLELANNDFKIKLLSPSPVGIESEKEYLIINTDLREDKVKTKLQELFPDWIEIVESYDLKDFDELSSYSLRDVYVITIHKIKGSEVVIAKAFLEEKNAKNIIDFKVEDGGVKVAASSILSNGMCDIVAKILEKTNKEKDFDIVRKKLLLETPNGLVEVDSYLEEKAKGSIDI